MLLDSNKYINVQYFLESQCLCFVTMIHDAQSVGCTPVLIDIDVIQDGFAIRSSTWYARFAVDGHVAIVSVYPRVTCPLC